MDPNDPEPVEELDTPKELLVVLEDVRVLVLVLMAVSSINLVSSAPSATRDVDPNLIIDNQEN